MSPVFLAKERRLVILGPPGSGKSTLMRCLALALAADSDDARPLATGLPKSTVPILLPLKTYAARLKKDPALKLDVFLNDEVGRQAIQSVVLRRRRRRRSRASPGPGRKGSVYQA